MFKENRGNRNEIRFIHVSGDEMSRVNKRIVDKINESKYDKNIKDFLKSILFVELERLVKGTLMYGKEYDRCIMKFLDKED